ncbi:GTP 3',8-cyclase MoaA [Anaerococcus porci]|uniref:GTP 3',8-cyclase MoaA n=1 Tax=Anaerococcus porci TaxID=2652269 RepID=UPI002A765037|nr:GTP 3',8-cyclase MoaA [Anaerococcus porci]MDY3005687.1 GTP 3',8-cyclase MoaA [Anaerococcus porci]
MLDKFNRRIDYLRISVTDRCNLRCAYCMPDGINKKDHSDILSFEDIRNIVEVFVEKGIRKVRLTGGEPLVRKNIETLVKYLSSFEEIKDLSMTSNGFFLEEKVQVLKDNGLDRFNISLDSLDFEKYKKISKNGDLKKVLRGIYKAKSLGMGVKINCVLIKGINEDEVLDFIEFSKKNDLGLRFIELMPIGKTQDFARDNFLSSDDIVKKYGLKRIENPDKNSPTSLYKMKDSDFKIGFIDPLSHRFCSTCNRLRITSDGFIRPCLHSDVKIDLKEGLDDREKLSELIDISLYKKPLRHHLEEGSISESMNRIGG